MQANTSPNHTPSDTPILKRGIRKWDLVLMIINSIIGAGIFGLPSKIYQLTGVYSILAFVVCAVVVLVFILCFAEVGSRFDSTGGPYAYTLRAFGKFPAFLVGWLLLLSRIFNYATLINLFVTYMAFFIPGVANSVNRALVMIGVTGMLAYLNYLGVKNTARISNVLTIAKLVPLAIFIIAGFFFLDKGLFVADTVPPLSSFSGAVLLLVFAFGGFESVMVNTGEIKEPSKTIPFALLMATFVVASFYILIQITSIGTLPNLATSQKPLADAATGFWGNAGGTLIAAGAVVSILGTLNVLLLSGSRLPYALSLEGQFPSVFTKLNASFATPTFSIIFVAVASAVVSIFWSFLTALTVAVIIRIAVYFSVCASLLMLRKKEKEQTAFYKLPFGKGLAITGICICIWLLTASTLTEIRNAAILLAVGVAGYFLFKAVQKKVS